MRHPALIPLSHDHHHGLALALRCRKQALGQVKPMGPDGLRERAREVLGFYSRNLVPHFRAEEEILFPLLRSAAPESVKLIEELTAQHDEIHRAIPSLESGRALAKGIFDLSDLLERHIRKEERELFPLFERYVTATQAESVAGELRAVLGSQAQS